MFELAFVAWYIYFLKQSVSLQKQSSPQQIQKACQFSSVLALQSVCSKQFFNLQLHNDVSIYIFFYIHCSVHHYNCTKIITNKMTLMDYPLFQG